MVPGIIKLIHRNTRIGWHKMWISSIIQKTHSPEPFHKWPHRKSSEESYCPHTNTPFAYMHLQAQAVWRYQGTGRVARTATVLLQVHPLHTRTYMSKPCEDVRVHLPQVLLELVVIGCCCPWNGNARDILGGECSRALCASFKSRPVPSFGWQTCSSAKYTGLLLSTVGYISPKRPRCESSAFNKNNLGAVSLMFLPPISYTVHVQFLTHVQRMHSHHAFISCFHTKLSFTFRNDQTL